MSIIFLTYLDCTSLMSLPIKFYWEGAHAGLPVIIIHLHAWNCITIINYNIIIISSDVLNKPLFTSLATFTATCICPKYARDNEC